MPQIEFGVGFDNRKETSFQPVDQTSYNHGMPDSSLCPPNTLMFTVVCRFRAEHRHHHPVHLRRTHEHLRRRRAREADLRERRGRCRHGHREDGRASRCLQRRLRDPDRLREHCTRERHRCDRVRRCDDSCCECLTFSDLCDLLERADADAGTGYRNIRC